LAHYRANQPWIWVQSFISEAPHNIKSVFYPMKIQADFQYN